jgi:hypothetical protein
MGKFQFAGPTESWTVGGQRRVFNLVEDGANPVTGALSLLEAKDRLVDGLHRMKELAGALDRRDLEFAGEEPAWTLVLDQQDDELDMFVRSSVLSGDAADMQEVAESLRTIRGQLDCRPHLLGPVELDTLTVADDGDFFSNLSQQINLPQYFKDGLPRLYS